MNSVDMLAKFFFIFLCLFELVTAQSSCSDYIQYYQNSALITLKVPVISQHHVSVKVKFETVPQNGNGAFDLETSLDQAVSNIKSSLPVQYRFWLPSPSPNAKIISIYHNGNRVCEENFDFYRGALATFHHSLDTGIRLSGSYPIPFNYNSVSYPHHTFLSTKLPRATVPPPLIITRPTTHIPIQKATTTRKSTTKKTNENFTCGERKINRATSFIRGGARAQPHDFPWLVAHFYRGRGFVCGGSLVSQKIVVTAAHCILDKHQDRFTEYASTYYLGKHRLTSTLESAVVSGVDQFHIHEDWDPYDSRYKGDIAIAVLTKTIVFDRAIQPICIWDKTENFNDLINKEGIVAGWGLNKNGSLSDVPQYVEIPVVQEEVCIRTDPLIGGILSEKSFCAGGELGEAPCKGDSGGGLIFKVAQKFYLRGIVSAAITNEFCEDVVYAIYTDVAQYTSWIKNFIITYG